MDDYTCSNHLYSPSHTIEYTHQKASKTLVVSLQYSSYPINEELLHQLFSPYGSVEIIRICTVDGCTSVILQYQSIYSVIAAQHNLQGRCVYVGCSPMDIQFVDVGWSPVIDLMIKHGRNSCRLEDDFSDLENTSITDVISENLQLEDKELFASAVFDEMLDSHVNDNSMDEQVRYDDYENDHQEVNNSFIIDDGTVNWTITNMTSSFGEPEVSSTNLQFGGISNRHPNIQNDTCISEFEDVNCEVTASISDPAKFDSSKLEEKHFDTPEVFDKFSKREDDDYLLANKVLYDGYDGSGVDDQILGDAKLNSKSEIDIPYALDNLVAEKLLESSSQLLSFTVIVDQYNYLTLVLLLIKGLTSITEMTSFLVVLKNLFTEIPPVPPDIPPLLPGVQMKGVYTVTIAIEVGMDDQKSGFSSEGVEAKEIPVSKKWIYQFGTSIQLGSDTQRLEALCLSDNVEQDARRAETKYSLKIANNMMAINDAAQDWGLRCIRYEIKDISPPRGIKAAMEMQAEAERKKRAQILESEGERQANINIADGKKSSVMLEAQGEAEAILQKAQATAKGIRMVAETLQDDGGSEAAGLRIAEQYVHAFTQMAKESTTILLPADAANPASMISQALTIYKRLPEERKNIGSGSKSKETIEDTWPEEQKFLDTTTKHASRHLKPVFSLQNKKDSEE